jgi:subtilisin family serine protease
VLDAGIDAAHPDLAGRIAGAGRFGSGDPLYPTTPHGTATAGLIAAVRGNGVGIDGIAPNALLLSADVSSLDREGSFDVDAVNRAIRWAADQGARVVNLSLASSGLRPGQQEAVAYALRRGALVVAAAGNCWEGASNGWAGCSLAAEGVSPAWLPHVLAVGATGTDYENPAPADFSVPSRRWVDVVAPGSSIATLWPTRNSPYLDMPSCPYWGTTACYLTGAPSRYWAPSGTSYATAMVSAAAAILFGADPALQPGQVARLLEETARPLATDPEHQAGAGMLDIAAALERVRAGQVPPADFGEPNERPALPARLPQSGRVSATVDWSDDPHDAYSVRVRRGDHVTVRTDGAVRADVRVEGAAGPLGTTLRAAARRSGTVTIEVSAATGAGGAYRLRVTRSTLAFERST